LETDAVRLNVTPQERYRMEKIRREYPDIAQAGPTYARAVRAGDMLFISGCTARGTEAQGGSATEQLNVTMDRIVGVVLAEGGSPVDIVKLTTFVTDIANWFPFSDEQQAVFDRHFDGQNPANSLVEISALAEPGLDIEIEAIAVLG
jgi:2-iminobutanoate/2-iminopropanoate deaminase